MSTILKRILALSLVLILAFAFVGCAEEELTQEEVDQIVANAVAASAEVDSYKFDMNMPMTTMEVIGGAQPGEMAMAVDGAGVVDNASQEMQMTMNMTMDIPEQGEQEMAMETYLVGEWMYMKMSMDEQWMKMQLTEEMWEPQSQIDQQVELLETATEVNYLRSENVDGTACYIMEIVPSMEALGNSLSQRLGMIPGMEGIDFSELDLASLFKEMSFKQWIAKDSYLTMKSGAHMLMEMSPGDVGATGEDFEKMTMSMDTVTELYDYNQAVSIELPEEALEAPEMLGL
jgi:hypothetical protein